MHFTNSYFSELAELEKKKRKAQVETMQHMSSMLFNKTNVSSSSGSTS